MTTWTQQVATCSLLLALFALPLAAQAETVDTDLDGVCDAVDLCDGDDLSGDDDLDLVCNDLDPCFGDQLSGDADLDGACALDTDGVTVYDCDEGNDTIYPNAMELCDYLDNACIGAVPDEDADIDGDGETICEGDCDDFNSAINSTAPESCNGLDDDCDGELSEAETLDADGDGFAACDDCDDLDSGANPGATEICDAVDNDCDGQVPDDELDLDDDGFGECDGTAFGGDCDDLEPEAHIGLLESCGDDIDNNCDGVVDESCLTQDDIDAAVDQALADQPAGCSSVGTKNLPGSSAPWLGLFLGVAWVLRRRRIK